MNNDPGIAELWRANREILKKSGISTELDFFVNELFVVRCAVMTMETANTATRDGIAALLETLSNKISDLAFGRGSGDPLPV